MTQAANNRTCLQELVEVLHNEGIESHTIYSQVALLAAWSWVADHHPEAELISPDKEKNITVVMQAISQRLEAAGWQLAQAPDYLEMHCKGQNLVLIRRLVGQLKWSKKTSLLADLIALPDITQKLPKDGSILPLAFARFIAYQAETKNQHLLGINTQSDLLLGLADGAYTRRLLIETASPLTEALILISDIKVVKKQEMLKSYDVVWSVTTSLGSAKSRSQNNFYKQNEIDKLQSAWSLARHRAIILTNPYVLFSRKKEYYFLRKKLVDENAIETIIQLPPQSVILNQFQPIMMILDRHRSNDAPVNFVNANQLVETDANGHQPAVSDSEMFWYRLNQLISNRDKHPAFERIYKAKIYEQDYNLDVKRYVLSQAAQKIKGLKDTRPLCEVADIIRCQVLNRKASSQEPTFIEINGRDIDDTGQICPQKPYHEIELTKDSSKRLNQQRIRPGDILLVGKGPAKVAYVDNNCPDNWVANQVFLILRVSSANHFAPEYLYRYMASELVQKYLQEMASGTSLPVLKAHDIKQLPVPIPDGPTQQAVIKLHHKIMNEYQAIKKHKTNIDSLVKQYWNLE